MTLRAYVLGEPELIERPDGWYVEIYTGDGIASAGPSTEQIARKILADARRASGEQEQSR